MLVHHERQGANGRRDDGGLRRVGSAGFAGVAQGATTFRTRLPTATKTVAANSGDVPAQGGETSDERQNQPIADQDENALPTGKKFGSTHGVVKT